MQKQTLLMYVCKLIYQQYISTIILIKIFSIKDYIIPRGILKSKIIAHLLFLGCFIIVKRCITAILYSFHFKGFTS